MGNIVNINVQEYNVVLVNATQVPEECQLVSTHLSQGLLLHFTPLANSDI